VLLPLLSLDEDLLHHLGIGHLNIVCPRVDELIDNLGIHLLIFLSQKFHGRIHKGKKLLLLFVVDVGADQGRVKILHALVLQLVHQLVVGLLLRLVEHLLETGVQSTRWFK
jgi:hypothetical protein